MTALLILPALAYAYRLRGSGLIGNTLGWIAWAVAVFAACLWIGLPLLTAALCAAGAWAGKLISHSIVYRLDKKSTGAWWSICFARTALMTAPLNPAVWQLALVAFAMLAANYLSRKAQDVGLNNDMLKLAEPLQGLWFGVALLLIAF